MRYTNSMNILMIVLQEEVEDYYEAYTHLFKLFNESPLIVCEIMKREREGERKKIRYL